MKTSRDLLLEAKQNLAEIDKKPTWWELALTLNVSQDRLKAYMRKECVLPDELGIKLLPLLNYTEAQVLFWLAAERGAKCPETAAIFEWVEQHLPDRWPAQIAANG